MKNTAPRLLSFVLAPFALLAALSAPAAPVELTRAQASELYVVLSSAEAGFAPANTIAAADNLNALRPHVEALDKGKLAAQRTLRTLAKLDPAEAEARTEALLAQVEAKADEPLQLDLAPLTLTDDELAAAKLKPAQLAVLRRWLLPQAASPLQPPSNAKVSVK